MNPEDSVLVRSPSSVQPRADAQSRETAASPQRWLKRDSTNLQELEAGVREANERNSLNSRLSELCQELNKVRRINDLLEAENADLREHVLHQMDLYPNAADIRALARRNGPELAKSVGLLIDENKSLRLKLQSSIRSHARLQGTAADLGNSLREHEEHAYARDLAMVGAHQRDGLAATAMNSRQTSDSPMKSKRGRSVERLKPAGGSNFVGRYCACSEKLQELLDCIDSQIGSYERGVWQTQVNVLEEERDNLMLKAVVMRQRLAEVHARIVSDPFLAARFGGTGDIPGTFGVGRGRNAMTELRDTIVKLATAQDVNAELERRLANERNISRSWQSNLRALQRELRDHLADLAVAARASGLRCDILRGTIAQAGEAAAVKELQGFTRSEKESLRLLRLARDRIAADAQKLESYSARVRELEQEVADLRCDMTQLERGHTDDWDDYDEISDCEGYRFVAMQEGKASDADYECTMAALLTAKQLLIDRAEAEKALGLLDDRKRQLREQQEKYLSDADAPQAMWDDAGAHFTKSEQQGTAQMIDLSLLGLNDFGAQSRAGNPKTRIYSALTMDRAREIFRRLTVLRQLAGQVSLSFPGKIYGAQTTEGPSDEAESSKRMEELKQLQRDIDQREISLQQAEEAVQARAALRRLEAEQAKMLQKKQAELEEQWQKQVKQAHEQMLKQQERYEQQLAKERDCCESLRKEIELQAKELDLQRHLAEERIREKSHKQQEQLEKEIHQLREQQRDTELQLQRLAGEAARETSALRSAIMQEKASLSASAQAAERKASEALKLLKEKEQELKELESKLAEVQKQRSLAPPSPAPPPQPSPSPVWPLVSQIAPQESAGHVSALREQTHTHTLL